jgi:gluconolactonase
LPDGRVIFVESYRSRVSVWHPGSDTAELYADVGGGPNAALYGADGCVYVTQNGGKIGPWRAEDQRPPSIQRVDLSGRVEILAAEVDGITLMAPNDLAFGPDGRLYFTDPGGAYDPVNKANPGFIFALNPDGSGECLEALPPVFPNGIVVEADGNIVWVESYTGAVKRRTVEGFVSEVCVLPNATTPDGFKVAANGDFYITGVESGGLDLVAADGTYKAFLPVGRIPTNCVFSGSTLYVTDAGRVGLFADVEFDGALLAVDLDDVTGMDLFPGKIA